jgi:hypothetical protein
MMPSQDIDLAKNALTIMSERSRTPSDLLHRALAHINYRAFDVGRLTIFEDPAIAVFNMSPKPDNVQAKPTLWRQFRNTFYTKQQSLLLSVKVSSLDDTKQKFAVRYVLEDTDNQNTKQSDIAAPETFIEDMFGAIPDVSFSKADA